MWVLVHLYIHHYILVLDILHWRKLRRYIGALGHSMHGNGKGSVPCRYGETGFYYEKLLNFYMQNRARRYKSIVGANVNEIGHITLSALLSII